MVKDKRLIKLVLLFIPWLLSLAFESDPALSYLIAWSGSFFIFLLCYKGYIRELPSDLTIAEQIMRPVFLIQIIFVGYMACSSIFYFLNVLGYGRDGSLLESDAAINSKLLLVAQCQRYYVLGHAAFLTGLFAAMKYPVLKRYTYDKSKLSDVILILALVCLPVSTLSLKTPGLSQFYYQLISLSFIAGTLALALAIPEQKLVNTAVCIFLYLSNFYQAVTSGYKEPIIISVLILGVFLYPRFKKLVLSIFIPIFVILTIYLPTYNRIFRQNAWGNDVQSDEAYDLALDATLHSDEDSNNWGFFVYRLSEIDMFITFVQSTPRTIDYYGLKLVKQAVISAVPRVFWPSKPVTETLVMERVYNAGVVMRGSNVSAKPAYVVDSYLSAGEFGVVISLFLYGFALQFISQKAELLFGGYVLGTALIFSGLFQIFWRGLSFEFIFNSVLWSYFSMMVIHRILLLTHFLKKA